MVTQVFRMGLPECCAWVGDVCALGARGFCCNVGISLFRVAFCDLCVRIFPYFIVLSTLGIRIFIGNFAARKV